MFVKEFEVNRKGDWLILSPSLNENITTLSNIASHKHVEESSEYFTLYNIIDIRKELKSQKFNGSLNFLFQFQGLNSNYNNIQIKKIYIKPLNRCKYKNHVAYCNNFDNGKEGYFYYEDPYPDGTLIIEDELIQISSLPCDNLENPNWIFTGPTFNISYDKHLASDKKGPLKRISKNGWGFFRIAFYVPNTLYTPSKVTTIICNTEELYYLPKNNNPKTDSEEDPPPLYEDI
ncbi:hypothetical protein CPAV1605_1284 [seawater metagenome]|uniref:Uncharacterized protein n=1 Tax=seawater metagenome TaxID=1561972 RepID=A0A5E8CJE3_9ZZZZ